MKRFLLIFLVPLFMFSCETEDSVNYTGTDQEFSSDEIDIYFQQNFQDKYGCAVRWKWVDKYVSIDYIVTPTKRDVVIPTGEMIINYWIEPFLTLSKEGGEFIRNHFPPEIVFIGSPLRNIDGTTVLGYAEAGVRISLTELNDFDLNDDAWLRRQLETIHHEFTHTIHQKYSLPVGYNAVTPNNYTSSGWVNINESQAIALGMVTPYGTTSPGEDFAEIVSTYFMSDAAAFAGKYLTPSVASPELDEGKAWIAEKLNITRDYYQANFSIDIDALRDIIQERLKNR